MIGTLENTGQSDNYLEGMIQGAMVAQTVFDFMWINTFINPQDDFDEGFIVGYWTARGN